MCNSSRSAYKGVSIFDGSTAEHCNFSEEKFGVLSFSDLDLCGSPCHNENSTNLLLSLPFTMDGTDSQTLGGITHHIKREDRFTESPLVAQLSITSEDCELGIPQDWFLNTSKANQSKDFSSYLDITDDINVNFTAISDDLFGLPLDLNSLDPNKDLGVSQPNEIQRNASWLTKTTIAPDHLTLTTIGVDTPAENEERLVLQTLAIPSSVLDTCLLAPDEESETEEDNAASHNQPQQPTPSKSRKRQRQSVEPGTEEYKKKRELNNISVRKSREKARKKQQDTEERVEILSAENDRLQARVDSLEKELSILKGLFTNIGASLPSEVVGLMPSE